jgi:hypothetical protein
MKKKKLIVWSGGYDSTALLISEGFQKNEKFDTCYCALPNNEEQQEREMKARIKILSTLKERYPKHKHCDDYLFEYVCILRHKSNGGVSLPQPYVWATTLAWNINVDIHHNVYMGYVTGDCFWHIKHEFEQVVKWSLRLLNTDPKNKINLIYPFEWYNKKFLSDQIYNIDNLNELLYNIEVCEYQKKCGVVKVCSSCKRHIEEFGYMMNTKHNYRYM